MQYLKLLFSGRLNRRNYLLGSFLIVLYIVVLFWIYYVNNLPVASLFVPAVFGWFFSISLKVRRLHDLNWPGWLWLLTLLPVIDFLFELLLLSASGVSGLNKYGEQPKSVLLPTAVFGIQ